MIASTTKALSVKVVIFSTSIGTSSYGPLSPFSGDRARAISGTTSPSIDASAGGGAIGRSNSEGGGTTGGLIVLVVEAK